MPPRQYDLADIERKLDRGDWLRPGEAQALLRTSRATVDRLMRSGRIAYRRRGERGQRELKPEDVRRELDDYRRERRGDGSAPPGDQPSGTPE